MACMGANLDVHLYSTASFIGGGVCGLRRFRSAFQLLKPLVLLSRPGVVWDFFYLSLSQTPTKEAVVAYAT